MRGLGKLSPGGSAISAQDLWRVMRIDSAPPALENRLGERLGQACVSLHASGRDAMRSIFVRLAERSGRSEIILPAYCCYSLPASAIAAKLKVRFVDLDERGRIDAASLESLPLANAAALVVSNLFGLADPVERIGEIAQRHALPWIDDAAQSLGARDASGAVGIRSEHGVLSFGRGKPVSAMGGGAAIWREAGDASEPAVLARRSPTERSTSVATQVASDVPTQGDRFRALMRALGYDLARVPPVFRLLSSIPALHIGETEFNPEFRQGSIDGSARILATSLLASLDASNADRRARAETVAAKIRERSAFSPLVAESGSVGIYSRLAILAPDARARDGALEPLREFGATAMYPALAPSIPELASGIAGEPRTPGAARFCARLITLPAHPGLTRRRVDRVMAILRDWS